jgi:Ca2+-dependent lipid-binding protein
MTLLDERERVAINLTLSMDYIPVEKNIEMGQLRVDVLDAIFPGSHLYSYAYCKFYLNGQMVFKTHSIKKPGHPAWNEFFEIEVPSRIDAILRVTVHTDDGILKIEKVVGTAAIDLQLLEPCRPQDFTIEVPEASGWIRLQLLFRPEWTTRARRHCSIS